MGSRTGEGYRTLGAFLRRQRGHRSLREIEDLSRSGLFIGQPGVVSASALNSIENGLQKPSVETLVALTTLYGVPLQRLLVQVRTDRAPDGRHDGGFFQELLARWAACARGENWAGAHSAAHQALELASLQGERSRALEAVGISLLGMGCPAEAAGALHEAVHHAEEDPGREISLSYHLALAHRDAGNLRMASALLRTLRRVPSLREALADAPHVHLLAAGLELRRAEIPWLLGLERDVTETAREAARAAHSARTAFEGLELREEARESALIEGAAWALAGEEPQGIDRLLRILEEARGERDLPGEVRALTELGKAMVRTGSPAQGAMLLENAERIAARLGDPAGGFLASFHLVRAAGTGGQADSRHLDLLRVYRPLAPGWLLEARLCDRLCGTRSHRSLKEAPRRQARNFTA